MCYIAVMPNTSPIKYESSFTMRVDKEFLDKLDKLRESDRPVLNRSDYLRKLVFEKEVRK